MLLNARIPSDFSEDFPHQQGKFCNANLIASVANIKNLVLRRMRISYH
jgi:hypothetical protein